MVKYNKPKKQSFDRDPGREARAKRAALKKKMGDTRPDGGAECAYNLPSNPKFCTNHSKHH